MKEKYELAYSDYLDGMKYKDIASKYGVTISAVKSWKSRYWKDKKLQPKKTKVATKEVAQKIAKDLVEDDELKESDMLFCIYFLKYHNATKAYMKVHPNSTYGASAVSGGRLMKKPEIQAQIKKLKEEMYTDALLDPADIIQKYIDIAFADITDYMQFDEKGVRLINWEQVDGTIVKEVRETKHGVGLELMDRTKALEFLAKNLNFMTEEQKAKVRLINSQIDKTNGIGKEVEDMKPLIDLLRGDTNAND